jgi:molybdenum cofactor biosynthesis enzyme
MNIAVLALCAMCKAADETMRVDGIGVCGKNTS